MQLLPIIASQSRNICTEVQNYQKMANTMPHYFSFGLTKKPKKFEIIFGTSIFSQWFHMESPPQGCFHLVDKCPGIKPKLKPRVFQELISNLVVARGLPILEIVKLPLKLYEGMWTANILLQLFTIFHHLFTTYKVMNLPN